MNLQQVGLELNFRAVSIKLQEYSTLYHRRRRLCHRHNHLGLQIVPSCSNPVSPSHPPSTLTCRMCMKSGNTRKWSRNSAVFTVQVSFHAAKFPIKSGGTVLRVVSSRMWLRVFWYAFTEVSGKPVTYTFRVSWKGITFLGNTDIYQTVRGHIPKSL